jgi:transposase
VITIDELGPLAVKTYPGEQWKHGPDRATFEPDYGRRGKLWVHGAFEPSTGEATLVFSNKRDSKHHILLLEQMVETFPSERWLVIEDNLTIHKSGETQTALLAWPEIQVQFIPKYACWLNLIEPWWKQLKSLALKGRRFETVEQLESALREALAYWNAQRRPYRWKKHPQEQAELAAMGAAACKLGGYGSSIDHLIIMT